MNSGTVEILNCLCRIKRIKMVMVGEGTGTDHSIAFLFEDSWPD